MEKAESPSSGYKAISALDGRRTFAAVEPKKAPITDVADSAWYAPAVARMYESGVLDGVSADRFDPAGHVTVAQAVKLAAAVLARGTGCEDRLTATEPWYGTYWDFLERYADFTPLGWDLTAQRLDGAAPSWYDAGRPVTRGELAYLAALSLPYDQWSRHSSGYRFSDLFSQPGNSGRAATPYYTYIDALYWDGIVSGYGDGTFRPGEPVTRAEAAAIFARVMDPESRLTPS